MRWWTVVAVSLICTAATTGRTAERFRLEIPGDSEMQSTAELEDGRLTIVTDGRVHRYEPQPRYDSADGRYRAFYSDAASQFVRWPTRGGGSMYIGRSSGNEITWRESLMRVVPLNDPVPRVPPDQRDPFRPRPRENDRDPFVDQRVDRGLSRAGFAVLRGPGDELIAALIDDGGNLQLYESERGQWRRRQVQVQMKLDPGAPLVLVETAGRRLPVAFTVNQNGELVVIRDGGAEVLRGRGAPRFARGTHLALIRSDRGAMLFAVDARGRLWQLDTQRFRFQAIESREGYLQPGTPLAAVQSNENCVYLVDLQGNLLEYRLRADGWSGPALVAESLPPSCTVSAAYLAIDAVPETYLAVVDTRGRLLLLNETRGGWKSKVVAGARLAPAAPVDLAVIDGHFSVSGVAPDGRWIQWYWQRGAWRERVIATGLPPGSPVALNSQPATALAIDHSYRLIAGRWTGDGWKCSICAPAFDWAPRLVSRQVIPNPPLQPVTVHFDNSHDEPLVVRIFEDNDPGPPREVRIPPGGSAPVPVERDAGGVFEEVYIEQDPLGGTHERVHRLPIPPRSLHQVVVYADRVTSVYFDRTTNKGPVPDEVNKSLVSLGTFRLPAGAELTEGEHIDVAREVAWRQNPGAASLIEATRRP